MYIHVVHAAGKGTLTEYSLTHSSISFPNTIWSHPHSSSLLHTLTPFHPSSSTQADLMKQYHKYLHKVTDLYHNQVHTYVHVPLNLNKTTTLTPTWRLKPPLAQSYNVWMGCVCTCRKFTTYNTSEIRMLYSILYHRASTRQ